MHITIIDPGYVPELWITKCGSKLIYETLQGKEEMYVWPITSILVRLPVVGAGDTGTIPFRCRSGCRNGTHRYSHELASADSSRGLPNVLREFLGAGLVQRPLKCNEVQRMIIITYYFTLLHIILYYYIHHYYILLRSLLIHDYYTLLHQLLLRIITALLLHIITSLLHHYYIIITSLLHHYYVPYYYIIITSLLH